MSFISKLFKPSGYNLEVELLLDATAINFDERCRSIGTLLQNRTPEEFHSVMAWLQGEVIKRKWDRKDHMKFTLYLYGIVLGVEAGAIQNGSDWKLCVNTQSYGTLKNKKVQIIETLNEKRQKTLLITTNLENAKQETPKFLNN